MAAISFWTHTLLDRWPFCMAWDLWRYFSHINNLGLSMPERRASVNTQCQYIAEYLRFRTPRVYDSNEWFYISIKTTGNQGRPVDDA